MRVTYSEAAHTGEQMRSRFVLWFFRELTDAQRVSLVSICMGEACGPVATTHAVQWTALNHILGQMGIPAITLISPPGIQDVPERLILKYLSPWLVAGDVSDKADMVSCVRAMLTEAAAMNGGV